jgi:adenine-specific DNA-methyltransferase
MNKIEVNDHETQSEDIVADNLSQLKSLFPEAFSEGKVQFDTLRQLMGDSVDETDEKYGLNWHGKRRARQIALMPSTGTLRPCPDESVDWDTTQNLMIEGDNLEVLKLLQKSYSGKIKLIYIDPPYNTGKDFVYPDNFRDSIGNYLELTGQVEGGAKITANSDANGRFHTDWLNMIYPRLKLARNLLKQDGLIFVSIDDNEAANLRSVMDEIFGAENFLAQIMWQKMYSGKADATHFGRFHEYILCYSRNVDFADVRLLPRTEEMNARYSNPDNDLRGPWLSNDLTAAGERSAGHYEIRSPSGDVFDSPVGKHWLYAEETMKGLVADNRIFFGKNGSAFPRLKRFLTEVQQGRRANTIWLHEEVGHTDEGTKELKKLMEAGVGFQAPKPTRLLRQILSLATEPNATDIVLDFFAGSGTTGDAVVKQNMEDGGNRRYVLVQLPEPLDKANKDQTAAYDFCVSLKRNPSLSELTMERLRRVGKKSLQDSPLLKTDFGFRVFRLDSSNLKAWNPDHENMAKTLIEHHEHIINGRTEADLEYELLLKLGLDLCVPMESRTVVGKTVGAVGGGVLMLCLAEKISAKEVEVVAAGIVSWHKELAPAGDSTVVFRDSAFADDVAKTNMAAILAQNGLENVRSL